MNTAYLDRAILVLASSVLFLAGCASNAHFTEGKSRFEAGYIEEALSEYRAALALDPNNARIRSAYLTAKEQSVGRLLKDANAAEKAGKPEDAKRIYKRILTIDEANARALEGLATLEQNARHAERLQQATNDFNEGRIESAEVNVRRILAENAQNAEALALAGRIEELRARPKSASKADTAAALSAPITIEFRDAQLRQILEVLSRTSGLNFVLDKDVRADQKTTIFLRDSTVAEALSVTLLTNQLEQRVLSRNSILIYQNNVGKLREYEQLSVKTFVLDTANAADVANTLRTILKTKDIVVDEKHNLLIMRGTPDAIRMAEKLVAVHDMPEPEVMLDVEILEVKRSKLLELGIQYPSSLSLTPLAAAAGGTVTLYDLQHLNTKTIGASLSATGITANDTVSDINVLANPRIRARNREKAKIQVGQRLPNITSTSTATGFVAESVQYVDVGLKLEVESVVSSDREVAIKIALEVSNITDKLTTRSGSTAYAIGTRNTSTVLRLRDGENQILAGLINNEERTSGNRIPGFGSIPVVGRLFGFNSDESLQSEIVLSITPHILRGAQRPTALGTEFETGTEASLRGESTTPLIVAEPAAKTVVAPLPPAGAAPVAPVTPTNNAPAVLPTQTK